MDDPLDWLLDEGATEPFVLRQDSRGTYWYVSPDLRRIRHVTSQKPQPIPVSNPRKEKIIALEEGLDGAMYVCTYHSLYVIRNDRMHKIADLPLRRRIRTTRISQMLQDAQGDWIIMHNGFLMIFGADEEWEVIDVSRASSYVTDYFVRQAPDRSEEHTSEPSH